MARDLSPLRSLAMSCFPPIAGPASLKLAVHSETRRLLNLTLPWPWCTKRTPVPCPANSSASTHCLSSCPSTYKATTFLGLLARISTCAAFLIKRERRSGRITQGIVLFYGEQVGGKAVELQAVRSRQTPAPYPCFQINGLEDIRVDRNGE